MNANLDSAQSTAVTSSEGDRIARCRFERIAEKIQADPDLLKVPLSNIARWLAQGHSARERLEGWRRFIAEARESDAGMTRLLTLLREDSAEANAWKGFSPFAGVLTREELDGLRWTSRH